MKKRSVHETKARGSRSKRWLLAKNSRYKHEFTKKAVDGVLASLGGSQEEKPHKGQFLGLLVH